MNYVIDIVSKAVERLGAPTSTFQRDGMLYIVSPHGFGQVNYGLRTQPQPEHRKDEPEFPEILESHDISASEKLKTQEAPRLKPILFGEDSTQFSLEALATTAAQLAQTPDDGKIRMVQHGSRYRSHKYGYAMDGTDVWLDSARVMDRNRYFELMRQNEDTLLANLAQHKARIENKEQYRGMRGDVVANYGREHLPSGVVMTPHLIALFPRPGNLTPYASPKNSWSAESPLEAQFMECHPIDTESETPFRMHLILNNAHIIAANAKEFTEKSDALAGAHARDIAAIGSAAPDIEQYIAKLTAVHQDVCGAEIAYWKDFRERLRKDREAPAKS